MPTWSRYRRPSLEGGTDMAWSFAVTMIIMVVLKRVLPKGVRVDAEDEETGLDLTQHSETGYALDRV